MSIAEKLKTGIKTIAGGLVVLLFLSIGLKGCVVTLWTSPQSVETYAITGEDGRSIHMVFFPGNETVIEYRDPTESSLEVVRVHMRGTYGSHLIGPIWSLDGPGPRYWFGLR